MRLYGPLEQWFDKAWWPSEIELVKLKSAKGVAREEKGRVK